MGELRGFPQLAVREGHMRPKCLGQVHVLCGVEDPNTPDLHMNVTCNRCAAGAVTAPPAVPLEAETMDEPPKNASAATKTAMKKKKETPKKKKQVPAKKKTTAAKTKHPKAVALIPEKLKKSPAAQAFRLSAATGTQDPLIMQSVCFFAEDEGHGQESVEHFGGVRKIEKSLCCVDGSKCLFGDIVYVSKLPEGKGDDNLVAHDVQWEDLAPGETKIDLQVALPAADSSVRMVRRRKNLGSSPSQRKKHCPDKLFAEDIQFPINTCFVLWVSVPHVTMDCGSIHRNPRRAN
jgi:hypothetical protein